MTTNCPVANAYKYMMTLPLGTVTVFNVTMDNCSSVYNNSDDDSSRTGLISPAEHSKRFKKKKSKKQNSTQTETLPCLVPVLTLY